MDVPDTKSALWHTLGRIPGPTSGPRAINMSTRCSPWIRIGPAGDGKFTPDRACRDAECGVNLEIAGIRHMKGLSEAAMCCHHCHRDMLDPSMAHIRCLIQCSSICPESSGARRELLARPAVRILSSAFGLWWLRALKDAGKHVLI